MYLEYFGLTKQPFGITPDTSLFFEGAERGDVLNAILYALNSGEGIIKVVGEVGSGKTMLSRMLANRASDNTVFVFLLNPSIQAEQVLYAIAYDLGLQVDANDKSIQILHVLQQKLFDIYKEGKKVVLVIDEAQQMPLSTLEEIRLLSNLETETEKLLQIILFGQPELDEHIDTPNIRQLRERITYSFYLSALNWRIADTYLHFRLKKAGHQGRAIFTTGAIKLLTKYANGTLRRLNVLADKSLLAAFLHKSSVVGTKHVKLALKDTTKGYKKPQAVYYVVAAFILFMTIASLAAYFFVQSETRSVASQDQGGLSGELAVQTEAKVVQVKSNISLTEGAQHNRVNTPLSERLKAFDRWKDKTNDLYTIQLMSSLGDSSSAVLEKFLTHASHELDFNQVYVNKTTKGVHIVYYRGFSSYSQALSELKRLPITISRYQPYITNI